MSDRELPSIDELAGNLYCASAEALEGDTEDSGSGAEEFSYDSASESDAGAGAEESSYCDEASGDFDES
jgi:hypothetical protein